MCIPSSTRYLYIDTGHRIHTPVIASKFHFTTITNSITLTKAAEVKLLALSTAANKIILKISVTSGGCSGFLYTFNIEKRGGDIQNEVIKLNENCSVVVDPVSLKFLKNCRIDFVEEIIASDFQILHNDLASSSCSCGRSFDLTD